MQRLWSLPVVFSVTAILMLPALGRGEAAEPPLPSRIIVKPLPFVSPPPPAEPTSATTPTLWIKPVKDRAVLMAGVTESMALLGSRKCAAFTITAALSTADAVTVLNVYQTNEVIATARLIVPPSIIYDMKNAAITSYSQSASPSGSTATFTITPASYDVVSGGSTTRGC